MRITPSKPREVERLDALVLGGGADVSPDRYGMEPMPADDMVDKPRPSDFGMAVLLFLFRWMFGRKAGSRLDDGRDELEFRLLGDAVGVGLPVLGICRGCQLINVHMGGALYQDLKDFYVEYPQVHSVLPRKRVLLEPGSLLSEVFRSRTLVVNALHRQAVSKTAPGLIISAREINGVVQAVERENNPFLVGVQWHPEYMPQSRTQARLFRALVKAAR